MSTSPTQKEGSDRPSNAKILPALDLLDKSRESPKPDELVLARMKLREIEVEVRTGESFKILG